MIGSEVIQRGGVIPREAKDLHAPMQDTRCLHRLVPRFRLLDASRLAPIATIVLLLQPLSGCTTIAKRAFKEVRGANTKVRAVPGLDVEDVSRYGRVEIAPIRTDIGDLVDPMFNEVLPSSLLTSLTEARNAPFGGGGELLTIEPEVRWYLKRKTIGSIFGSDAFAVVLFWLKTNGQEVGRLQAETRSGAARTDAQDMAANMAQSLADYFRKQLPNVEQDDQERRDEAERDEQDDRSRRSQSKR